VQLGDLTMQHLFVGRPSPRSGSPFAHRLSISANLNMKSQKFKETETGQGRKARVTPCIGALQRCLSVILLARSISPANWCLPLMMVTGSFTWSD